MKFIKRNLLPAGTLAVWLVSMAAPAQTYNFTTIAGNAGYGATDGTNSSARFNSPVGVATDANGNFYIADFYNP